MSRANLFALVLLGILAYVLFVSLVAWLLKRASRKMDQWEDEWMRASTAQRIRDQRHAAIDAYQKNNAAAPSSVRLAGAPRQRRVPNVESN